MGSALLHSLHRIQLHSFPRDEYLADGSIEFGNNCHRTSAFNSIEVKAVYRLPHLNTITFFNSLLNSISFSWICSMYDQFCCYLDIQLFYDWF